MKPQNQFNRSGYLFSLAAMSWGLFLMKSGIRTLLFRSFCSASMMIAVTTCAVFAAGIGGQGGAVYRAPAGAKAFALGGAQTADPSILRLWWNPATLANLKARSASLGGGLRSFGRTEAEAGMEFPLPPRMGVGFSLLYRGDAKLDNLHDAEDRLLPKASYVAYAVHAGASYQITRKVAAGAAIEYLYQKMPVAGDPNGITYATSRPALGLGPQVRRVVTPRGYCRLRYPGAFGPRQPGTRHPDNEPALMLCTT